ncbi:hypothetical protein ACJIZ3_007520 [Penstemon smallii]|uniref:DUF7894 domain-containing protein n=1 Tax=Penstemon smallii TaxID=265156 RepID=A0ABD3SAT8_9LAMI
MKLAEKVILLLNGAAAISGGLHPNPNSNFRTLNESFELPLERYGIKDRKASGQIIDFINSDGHYEVSILLLQNYEPPILACALNEILLNLAGDDLSTTSTPTLLVPFIVPESKLKQQHKCPVTSDKVSIYGIELGPTTDLTHSVSSRMQKPPPSLQIYHEDFSLLLHLLNVMKLPTVVLIGQSHISNKTLNEEHEVMFEIGEHLANVTSLSFSKEKMVQNPSKTSKDSEEAWRALYG